MKVFDYKTPCSTSVIPYSEAVYIAAQEEAKRCLEEHSVVCEVSEPYDDGRPEPETKVTTDEVLNALLGVTV